MAPVFIGYSISINMDDPIIVIDDDLDDQFLIQKVCEDLGVKNTMLFFDDGREVLKYLRKTTDNPFIILCDINMPIMSGLEIRREMNEDEFLRLKSIPFVFLSTAASPAQIKEAYLLTVQGFFIKATTMEKLQGTMKLILSYWQDCRRPNANR
jgi:CheY-like chemotaxis protein